MTVLSETAFILLYQLPCGKWYVHSHKIYPSVDAAMQAAIKFLPSGTVISIMCTDSGAIEANREIVQ